MGTKCFPQFYRIISTSTHHTGNSPHILYKLIYSDPLTLCTSITASKVFPSIIMLHLNCSQNIPLSNTTATNTSPTRELTLNSTYPKVHIFHYFFGKKSYLITQIQFNLVMGIICIYDSISPHFQFFLSICSNM